MLKDLVLGSQVATANGWATVTTFMHWHPNQTVAAVKISHDEGTLTLSPSHMVFTMTDTGDQAAVPAKNLEAGSKLLVQVESPGGTQGFSVVRAVEPTTMEGYYAPLTSSGTIIVDNVIASCYTQYGDNEVPHWSINILMAPLRFAPSWLLSSFVPSAGEIHPYIRLRELLWLADNDDHDA